MAALIDEFMPQWDVRERHRLHVPASPDETWPALRRADLGGAPVVRLLLLLRALPAALVRGPEAWARLRRDGAARITLATFERQGFRVLAERPPSELAIGLEGQFWRPSGNIATPDADVFATSAPAPGTARALWDFTIAPAPGGCVLATETRVLCADDATRRRFLPYWWAIRPGSGIIRRLMLRAVRNAAAGAG